MVFIPSALSNICYKQFSFVLRSFKFQRVLQEFKSTTSFQILITVTLFTLHNIGNDIEACTQHGNTTRNQDRTRRSKGLPGKQSIIMATACAALGNWSDAWEVQWPYYRLCTLKSFRISNSWRPSIALKLSLHLSKASELRQLMHSINQTRNQKCYLNFLKMLKTPVFHKRQIL